MYIERSLKLQLQSVYYISQLKPLLYIIYIYVLYLYIYLHIYTFVCQTGKTYTDCPGEAGVSRHNAIPIEGPSQYHSAVMSE